MTYLIRRIAKTQQVNVWQVAALMSKICRAYEESGRSKAQIYLRGGGLPPGDVAEVVAEWTQESIEENVNVTEAILSDHRKMQELLTAYPLEFHILVTDEELRKRGVLD